MTSVGVRQYTQDVRVFLCVSVFVCQHTQDVRSCPSVHISARWSLDSERRPFPWTVWVILAHVGCLFSTHRTSVGVRQHTQNLCGCLWLSVGTHKTSVAVRVCLCVSVCVYQRTQDVRGCPSSHTRRPCVSVSTHRTSVAFCVCPSVSAAHTGRPWLSISTHISTLVLVLSTLALPVDCLGDFGPRGLSVQYTHDVRGCPPAHIGRLWLSVAVRQHTQDVHGCPCVSVSIHRTSVAVHQCTYQHAGPWTQHTGPSRGLFGTHRTYVAVHQYTYQHVGPWTQHAGPSRGLFGTSVAVCGCPSAHTGHLWLSVCVRQNTQDIRGCSSVHISARCSLDSAPWPFPWTVRDVRVCPSAHTGRLWLSVCVCVCPSAHTGRSWLSISTHISTLVLGLSTRTLPVDCSGDFGPRGLSVQYTQDVCGCPPAHTGCPWLSVCVRVCPSVSVSTHRTSVAVHQYTYQHVGPWTQNAGPSHGLFG
ncbi:hypothetical protein YC2023_066011 [Brassica napus]